MRIGVRAHDFGKFCADDLAARIASQGLSCVQLTIPDALNGFHGSAGELNPGMANLIGEAFRRRGLQIAVLSCYINPIDPDEGQRRRQIDLFKEHLRFVRDFGCSIVATETGSVNPDLSFSPENHSERSFRLLIESVSELVEEAERFGVLVGIEGVRQFVASTPQRIRRMLDAVKSNNLQIVFDPVNLLSAENHSDRQKIVEESLDLFGDRIVAVHAKDFTVLDGHLTSVPVGTGMMDYRPIVKFLRERKPYLNLILEDTALPTIGGSITHLRELYETT